MKINTTKTEEGLHVELVLELGDTYEVSWVGMAYSPVDQINLEDEKLSFLINHARMAIESSDQDDIERAVLEMCRWDETPQGLEYWAQVAQDIVDTRTLPASARKIIRGWVAQYEATHGESHRGAR